MCDGPLVESRLVTVCAGNWVVIGTDALRPGTAWTLDRCQRVPDSRPTWHDKLARSRISHGG